MPHRVLLGVGAVFAFASILLTVLGAFDLGPRIFGLHPAFAIAICLLIGLGSLFWLIRTLALANQGLLDAVPTPPPLSPADAAELAASRAAKATSDHTAKLDRLKYLADEGGHPGGGGIRGDFATVHVGFRSELTEGEVAARVAYWEGEVCEALEPHGDDLDTFRAEVPAFVINGGDWRERLANYLDFKVALLDGIIQRRTLPTTKLKP